MLLADPHHIIAIGASAGGMEEINSFFDHTPLDGVSYIIVQHLSPDFKSRMVELLARHSKLMVMEAEDGLTIQSNQVYLIPPDKFMTIQHGKLYLTEKEGHSPHMTINKFFNSLALNSGKKAIGIVLSGLGSDGTEGVRAIKKAGGMVIARDPETSLFGSMPSHAIATGLVDFILEPELMPNAIEGYIKFGGLLTDNEDDEKNIKAIIDVIKDKSPLDFSDYKLTTILRRTKRRAAHSNFTTLGNYLNFLKVTPDEAEALSKDFLISVTSFFRDKGAFEFIQKNVFPGILKKLVPGEELKMWVAGCATGEEAYSLAILIAEELAGDFKDTVVKIFATDIDSAALAHAGKAVYSRESVKNVSAARLERHFIKEGDNYKIKPVIRKMVIFAQHDLVKNPPYCNMNFISCRNLLIYMTPILQRKVFTMLLWGLKMEGYLFLGSSENPMPIIKNLEVANKKWKIYKNLETKRAIRFDAFSLPEVVGKKQRPFNLLQHEPAKSNFDTMAEAVNAALVSESDQLVLCVDGNNQVIKSYGDTTKYLLQKNFNPNLIELLPKPLAVVFNTASAETLRTGQKPTVNGIKIKNGAGIVKVDLAVCLLPGPKEEQLLMVTLSDHKRIAAEQAEDLVFDEKIYHDKYTINLEAEVKKLKEKLNASFEQVDATNENMQSFNEELISANEEMQSTNEEMQSVNEELDTINSDYQLKNKELQEINDDLNNYFRSNINGQLFIDKNMVLMKFSPGTVKQINLRETDIGRPLSNISTNIKFETILEDIQKVLSEGTILTKEIETNNGKWYQIMTMPYVQADNTNNGAIITFNDVTELKKTSQKLERSNKMLGMAMDASEMGTWSINIQTREFIPSSRLKDMFGFSQNEEMTYEAAIAQIAPEYRLMVTDAIEANISRGEKFDLEYPVWRPHDAKQRWVRAVGNRSFDTEGKPDYFTGVLLDVTMHKQDELRKNDFIAMVSHELKTPLTSLKANIQVAAAKAKKNDDKFTVASLESANKQVKKMGVLIDGFLNLSSLESGKIYINEQVFEIGILINEIVEEVRLTNITHSIELHSCPALTIKGDREKIGQVINNFLSNAVKYSPKGDKIEVGCKQVNGTAQVSVSDNGMGIKPEDQDKLFKRYYRVDGVQTKNIAGFGLGLYLSAEIIHRHNGQIWVESKPGKGSAFYFSLPLS
jgi:two-component system CheB/CheR fusion protein